MIGVDGKAEFDGKPVEEAAKKAAYKNLGHAAASLRKEAIASIKKDRGPSPAGEPVHTRQGLAKRALLYAVDKEAEEAVVGFSAAVVDEAMAAHELGEPHKGTDFPKRPTIGPALERNASRLAETFEGTIGR
jgi:hypothetical protein